MIKDYSQHGEQQVITDYFQGCHGTLLDIGANDGITFSNSRALLELGWYGILVEPSEKTFDALVVNCGLFTGKVMLHNVGVADYCGDAEFFESGPLVSDADHSLISSMKETETERWKKKSKPEDRVVEFNKTTIPVIDYAKLLENSGNPQIDFITIDVEGMELEILKQIDFSLVSMVCVEYNGKPELSYAYGGIIPMPVIYKNRTNIIYAVNKT